VSRSPETPAQPEQADYVNDVPDWYSAAWPPERRCQHVLQTAAEYRDRWAQGRPCGYPTHDEQGRCLFHREGGTKPDVLREELERAVAAGVCLFEAGLSGAQLEGANLTGALLDGADLSGAKLAWADLSGAQLVEANLSGAVFWEANLSGAHLKGASLSGAKLEKANLSGALLWKSSLSGAALAGADLSGAMLSGADLSGADASDTKFDNANLREAKLTGNVNLRGADFTDALLANAELSLEAHLDRVTWWPADQRPRWRRALHLSAPVLRDERLAANEHDLHVCESLYRQIKQCHQHSGQYSEAGQFFVREMECRRGQLKSPFERGVHGLMYFLCDYFENWMRVVVIALLVILLGAWTQGLCGIHTAPAGQYVVGPGVGWPTLDSIVAACYFSVMTFTATGYGDYVPSPGLGQILAAVQALTGVFLMALLLVCLARKYGRA
jgi:uncharacterized protein YjbI with pentapeptide repeats